MSHLFTTLLVEPIYNVFVWLISVIPGHDAGLAIIALTILVRLLFMPAFTQALRTQHGMRRIDPELEAIKEKYKDDRVKQGQATVELFRAHGIKPWAGILTLFIQLPVFIALYTVVLREGFPAIAEHLLYSFTPHPQSVGAVFLGFLNLTAPRVIWLALLVGAVQFIQLKLSLGAVSKQAHKPGSQQAQMVMMQRQMLYIMPPIMAFVAYKVPAAAGLYLLTTTLITLLQELVVRRRLEAEFEAQSAQIKV